MQTNMEITYVPIGALQPLPGNPRLNAKAIPKVAESIKRFGWTNPILARRADSVIIAGHTRWEAAKRLGIDQVPVIFLDLDPVNSRLYALADNRLAEVADWDDGALAAMLRDLKAEDADVLSAGFGEEEISRLLSETAPPRTSAEEDDADVPAPPKEPRSKRGEIYELGPHRLMCGDSTSAADVARLMGGAKVDLLWTDPPYNVAYQGGTKDKLTILNDSMEDSKFREFLRAAFAAADEVMRPGAVFYVAHADSEGYNFRGAVRDVAWKLAQTLIWAKDAFVLGRQDYHWQHEPILYGWKDEAASADVRANHEPILYGWKLGAGHLVMKDRSQSTVWEFPRPKRNVEHPTMKPVELVERAVRNSSLYDGVVLDLFGGSGTTLIASARAGRRAFLMELDPRYCDVIRDRWASYAIRAGEGQAS